ncbi:MAG: prolyl oligopeptidase family serine peptidase [Myxococcota bacterium]
MPQHSRRDDTVDVHHGVPVADPYRWLEDPDAPEVVAWVDRQNRATEAFLAAVPERETIRARLRELVDYERYGAPVREGGAWFWFHNRGLQPHPVLCRAPSPDAPPVVVLDPNTLSDDGTVGLADWAVSRDGRWLAYATTSGGSDWNTIRVRDLHTGADGPDRVEWVKFATAAFLPDGSGFVYGRFPPSSGTAANKHHQLWLHRLGTAQDQDTLVYDRPDQPEWVMSAGFTDDGRWMVVYTSPAASAVDALWVAPIDPQGIGAVRPIATAHDGTYRCVGNVGRTLIVLTNALAPRGRVVAIEIDHPEPESWSTLVPEGPDKLLECTRVGDRLFCQYLHHAASRVVVYDLAGARVTELTFPGTGATAGFAGHADDTETYASFTSYTAPTTVYRIPLATLIPVPHFVPRVSFDPGELHSEQIFVASPDGTRVPATLCWRGERTGPRPTVLYGYGGFDIPLTPQFSGMIVGWLEQGGVYVVANLRGGGEYGRDWHHDGRRERKQNVFDDFVAVAEHLVASGVTTADRLAIWGHSNGGLLVGAVMTQRPELFAAAVPAVGVHDLLRFHRWTIGWAWADEYGTVDDPELFPVLLKYSPVHNTRPARYPATLVMTADHDDRVVPAHSFKFGAALQHAQQGPAPILLRIETRAGHGASKPLTKQIDEYTDLWTFLRATLRFTP